jgi:plasmid stabilization system protein ParE
MAYRVDITVRAERDITGIYAAIHAEEVDAARQWFRGLTQAIFSLEELPNRCPRTPESRFLRHLIYGKKADVYRVIFRVLAASKRVEILHVRHGAMRRLEASDLQSTDEE